MSMFNVSDEFKEEVSSEELERTKDHVFSVISDDDGEHVSIVPEPLAEDFNYPWGSRFAAVAWIVFTQDNHVNGKYWKLDNPIEYAKVLWEELSNIAVNDNDEIDDEYLHFEKGTHREDIWHWFEERFELSVATDLMNLQ